MYLYLEKAADNLPRIQICVYPRELDQHILYQGPGTIVFIICKLIITRPGV